MWVLFYLIFISSLFYFLFIYLSIHLFIDFLFFIWGGGGGGFTRRAPDHVRTIPENHENRVSQVRAIVALACQHVILGSNPTSVKQSDCQLWEYICVSLRQCISATKNLNASAGAQFNIMCPLVSPIVPNVQCHITTNGIVRAAASEPAAGDSFISMWSWVRIPHSPSKLSVVRICMSFLRQCISSTKSTFYLFGW